MKTKQLREDIAQLKDSYVEINEAMTELQKIGYDVIPFDKLIGGYNVGWYFVRKNQKCIGKFGYNPTIKKWTYIISSNYQTECDDFSTGLDALDAVICKTV